jgi:hypothetical protein
MLMHYKSPKHKLIKFFLSSRDKWKAKAQSAKEENKLLKNRIRFLEESKAKIKAKNAELIEKLNSEQSSSESLKK